MGMSKGQRDLLNNLLLLVSNTTMIIGVVLVGKMMPSHVLFWVLLVTIISMCVYFPVALIKGGRHKHAYNKTIWHPRRSGVIGFWWGLNFWFVVWANARVPGTIQVILNEMAVPVAMITSWAVLGKSFDYVHIAAGVFITLGGLVPMATAQLDVGGWTAIIWNILYFINAAAIPIAVVFTEYFVKLTPASTRPSHRPVNSPPSIKHVIDDQETSADYVVDLPWFLAWQSFYTMLMCIILAVILTPTTMSYHELWEKDLTAGFNCVFRGEGHHEDDCTMGPIMIVITALGSCFSNWMQNAISREESAVYSNMITALSGPLATIYFSVPAFMGRYYDSAVGANAATIISLIIVFAAVAFFKGHTWKLHKDGREPPRTKRAIMCRLNSDIPEDERPYNPLDDLPNDFMMSSPVVQSDHRPYMVKVESSRSPLLAGDL